MIVVNYREAGSNKSSLGFVLGERIVNAAAAAEAYTANTNNVVASQRLKSMHSFISGGNELRTMAQTVVDWVRQQVPAFNSVLLADAAILAPLSTPGKIICVGLNYADHCREQNVPVPISPILFTKFSTAIAAHGDSITWPAGLTEQVDYEAELAVIIGKEARGVSEADAMSYVGGYTIINDVSARDLQFADGQWIRGKSLDTFCPTGPFVVTPDAIPDPHNLAIFTRVNGTTLQASNTFEMIFKIPYLIAFISAFCTLEPGDIISTGTPHGVGVFRNPKIFLQPGDVVEVEIEKIGVLRNPVG